MTSAPKLISVIVPTYNRPDRLAHCLEALAAQTYPAFEVVISDDGSSPPAEAVAEAFRGRMKIRVHRQANAGPAAARNAAAALATGEWLAFTDDDCRPHPDWLSHLAQAMTQAPDALLGGVSENAVTEALCSEASQGIVQFLYDHAGERGQAFEFFTSNNMACARERFLQIGGFDPSFPLAAGEDRDFGIRWGRSGGQLILVPEARVAHWHRLNLEGFWRQQSNYGRGAFHLRRRLAARRERAVPFAGISFYSGLLTHPFRTRSRRPMAQASLVAMSQLAMISGFVSEWARSSVSPPPKRARAHG